MAPVPGESTAVLTRLELPTEHLVGKLLAAGEMSLNQALFEIRSFESSNMGASRQ